MIVDLDKLRSATVERDPFDYLVVPGFVRPDAVDELERDFPTIPKGGSFPMSELSCGPRFEALASELCGEPLKAAVSEKLDIDLTARPTMLTVRGRARRKDGRIHTDAKWKLVTLLLYLNRDWPHDGGHLRLLNSPRDLDDYAADVTPDRATAVFFRCADNAWHGHTPHVGERRAVQVNWVENERWLEREQGRHRWSSKLKRIWSGSRAPRA